MKALLALVFGLFVSSTLASAETLTIKGGSVTWQAVGNPGLVKIDGKGGKPTGSVSIDAGKASGTIECTMADFTTGIDKRDEHMREKYLQVATYSKASLKLDPVTASGEQDWTGQLTMKGVTKPVKGHAKFSGTDVEATFSVNLNDFNVGVPSFLGVTVAENVNVTVKAQASK